jgi:hypothetical protein
MNLWKTLVGTPLDEHLAETSSNELRELNDRALIERLKSLTASDKLPLSYKSISVAILIIEELKHRSERIS